MLSIGVLSDNCGAGAADYHLEQSSVDYYQNSNNGEPPGKWFGKGCEDFGLYDGMVVDHELKNLLAGYSEDGSDKLVQNAGQSEGSNKRTGGIDLCFSAPKDVSILHSILDDEKREIIEKAHDKAVKAALTYVEDNFVSTRRGSGSDIKREYEQTSKLAIAMFEHATTRGGENGIDPSLHTHCLAINTVKREDGTYGSIDRRDILENKIAVGTMYRAELAKTLTQELGIEFEMVESKSDAITLNIKGMDADVRREFSQRRSDIQKLVEDILGQDIKEADAKEISALAQEYKDNKEHVQRDYLYTSVKERAEEYNFTEKSANKLLNNTKYKTQEIDIQKVIDELTDMDVVLTEKQVLQSAANACIAQKNEKGEHVSTGGDISKAHKISEQIKNSGELIHVGYNKMGKAIYTTKAMRSLEKQVANSALLRSNETKHHVKESYVDKAINKFEAEKGFRPSPDQESALRALAYQTGGVAIMEGAAGTGKSTSVKCYKMAMEMSGDYKFYGCAPSGKAASGLQDGTGIESDTVHKLIMNIESGKTKLDSKSIVVADEVGMMGTKRFAELQKHCDEAGAKLVCLGDDKQLQAVEQGAVFRILKDRIGYSSLTQVFRQKDDKQRDASLGISHGDVFVSMMEYAKLDNVKEQAVEQIFKIDDRLKELEDLAQITDSAIDKIDINQETKSLHEERQSLIDDNKLWDNDISKDRTKHINMSETRADAMKKLTEAWLKEHRLNQSRDDDKKEEKFILTASNAETRVLNEAIHATLKSEGMLREGVKVFNASDEEREFCIGERILFTKNDKNIKVANGNLADITAIEKQSDGSYNFKATLLDSGREVKWNSNKYNEVEYGNAITIHKSQGATVETAFVLPPENGALANKELFYVALTRHTKNAYMFMNRDNMDKMLESSYTPQEFRDTLEVLSAKIGYQLPENYDENMAASKSAFEEMSEQILKPTAGMITYAKSIIEREGIEIENEMFDSFKQTRQFLNTYSEKKLNDFIEMDKANGVDIKKEDPAQAYFLDIEQKVEEAEKAGLDPEIVLWSKVLEQSSQKASTYDYLFDDLSPIEKGLINNRRDELFEQAKIEPNFDAETALHMAEQKALDEYKSKTILERIEMANDFRAEIEAKAMEIQNETENNVEVDSMTDSYNLDDEIEELDSILANLADTNDAYPITTLSELERDYIADKFDKYKRGMSSEEQAALIEIANKRHYELIQQYPNAKLEDAYEFAMDTYNRLSQADKDKLITAQVVSQRSKDHSYEM